VGASSRWVRVVGRCRGGCLVGQEIQFSLALESLVGWNQRGGGRKIICKIEGYGVQSGHVLDKWGCRVGESSDSIMAVSWVVNLV